MNTNVSPTELAGWGRTSPTFAHLHHAGPRTAARLVTTAGERGLLARGLGRSYGDAAQNGGGGVIRLDGSPLDVHVSDTGAVTAAGGVSFDDLLRILVPRGWFVPVTPGTRFVTVGGAIASDVHGKNHHCEGSFGNHVTRIELLLADGTTTELSPHSTPELFWATVGGMGLTGVILEASFQAIPITTSQCTVDTTRTRDLDEVMALMADSDDRYRYSVAWIDLMATGTHLGRSVLTRGDHATIDQFDRGPASNPLEYRADIAATVPPIFPISALNRVTIKAFNEMWYRKAPKSRTGELQTIPTYFHPLDMLGRWNRAYGPAGFIQYQIAIPFEHEGELARVVERVATSGAASFVTVLKRFGAANPAPLSFPTPGWTLTMDIPTRTRGLAAMLDELDQVILAAGGRHYLAKDAHTTPAAIRRGYPRLAEWQAIRNSIDPDRVWQSDLGRRLELTN